MKISSLFSIFWLWLWVVPGIAQVLPEVPAPGQQLSPEQLGDLVAPIALYPDPLLSQILVAATYPLELVQASQWLGRNRSLSGAALAQAAEDQAWDPSIQALLLFPDLVARLNQDIRWTTNLGNAFLNQQADLMDAVQRMRSLARSTGNLSSNAQQTVSDQEELSESGQSLIDIEPADSEIIYVPYYNPVSIWGPSRYYPYASWGYPVYASGIGFGFGSGIRIGAYFGGAWGGWGGWGWRPQWRSRSVVINNNFLYRNNFNRGLGGANLGRTPWFHDPVHRQAVPYAIPKLSLRFGTNLHRPGMPQQGLRREQPPPTIPHLPGSDRIGRRQIAPAPPSGRSNAFGGVRDGGAARIQSDHGFASLGPARSAVGAAPRQGGGGASPRQGGAGGSSRPAGGGRH